MKKRTKEEAAAAMRASRARKKAQPVTPAAVTPKKTVTPVTPVTPAAPAVCSGCQEKITEIARLRERIRTLEGSPAAKVDLPYRPPIDRPPLPPVACPLAPAAGKALDRDEAEALRLRVVADKVNRIRGYSTGHSIGSVRA